MTLPARPVPKCYVPRKESVDGLATVADQDDGCVNDFDCSLLNQAGCPELDSGTGAQGVHKQEKEECQEEPMACAAGAAAA